MLPLCLLSITVSRHCREFGSAVPDDGLEDGHVYQVVTTIIPYYYLLQFPDVVESLGLLYQMMDSRTAMFTKLSQLLYLIIIYYSFQTL